MLKVSVGCNLYHSLIKELLHMKFKIRPLLDEAAYFWNVFTKCFLMGKEEKVGKKGIYCGDIREDLVLLLWKLK